MANRYEMWRLRALSSDETLAYYIHDSFVSKTANEHKTAVAIFHVIPGHTPEEQRQRAKEYTDYLNAQHGAAEQARMMVKLKG